jgi:Growth inhibitor
MKRGEVWWVEFETTPNSNVQKTRPAVIVSNNLSNEYAGRVQIILATSKVSKLYPCECFVTILGKKAKLMADQIVTAPKSRLAGYIQTLTLDEQIAVNQILKIQLDLMDA